MPVLSLIKPLDQPLGDRRLLADLKAALGEARFDHFRFIVAFAKSGPLLRMRPELENWLAKGKSVEVIFGVDHQGTSKEVLELALEMFTKVYITREPGLTFHPKIYAFSGERAARCFVGSNNLTVGGTETNFESALCLDLTLPGDEAMLKPIKEAWNGLLPAACPATVQLTKKKLAELVASGVVPEEALMPKYAPSAPRSGYVPIPRPPRSGLAVKPPSALPAKLLSKAAPKAKAPASATPAPVAASIVAGGFAIQIKPHHNGEIFLSKTAALQSPAFFKWPFTGTTTPKKPGNPSYPQLAPDPRVNITVYGAGAAPVLSLPNYVLNTVYYEKKSEIRITASPLVTVVPDYSVMVMQRGETSGIDYEITVHRPDSPDYAAWVAACNQTMPSGGKQPRKFGWF